MKHNIATFGLAALLTLAITSVASAGLSVGDKMYFNGMKSGQVAGPYQTNAMGGSTFNTFWTFCVELDQRLWNPGNTTDKYHVVDALANANSTGWSLTDEVAYLYTNFVDGTLSGYDHTSVRDRNALQYGIWSSLGYADSKIKGETGISLTKLNEMKGDWAGAAWHSDYLGSGWTGLGDVWVAQISFGASKSGFSAGDPGQDILTMSPRNPGPQVPAPGAAVLGMLGLGMTGWMKRRQA